MARPDGDLSCRPYYEIKVCFYPKHSYCHLPSSSSNCCFALGYGEQPKPALSHHRNRLPWNEQLGINPWPCSSKDFLSASLANLRAHFSNRKRRFYLDTTNSRAVFFLFSKTNEQHLLIPPFAGGAVADVQIHSWWRAESCTLKEGGAIDEWVLPLSAHAQPSIPHGMKNVPGFQTLPLGSSLSI